jgi:uncharacterized protein (TIGR02246 family)
MRTYLAAASLVPLLVTAACAKGTAAATHDSTTTSQAQATSASAAPATANDAAAARKYIENADAKWAAAESRGDVNAIAANYADNVVTMYAGLPTARGRNAVRKGLDDEFAKTTYSNVNFHTDDVYTRGDLAIELGTAVSTHTPKHGGRATTHHERYMTVWEKQPDGTWKVVRDADVMPADTTKTP